MSKISQDIDAAAAILRDGGLIGLPTETVYGLAADATNDTAIKKVFQAKGRPADHPVIVHIASMDHLTYWAADISQNALRLAQQFWPGPLTLIFKRQPHVSDLITGGQETIGIRFPAHPMAKAVINALGNGVVAPSANRFGRISPTCATDVIEELGDKVDLVLEGGLCHIGIESTIIDCHSQTIRILRHGMLNANQINMTLASPLSTNHQNVPRVSGALASHYAPLTPVQLIPSDQLNQTIVERLARQQQVAVLACQQHKMHDDVHWFAMPQQPQQYAQCLYQKLRAADHLQVDVILVESVPQQAAWTAIQDRLYRSSFAP